MDYKNKVCIITGGALGIGRCLTREFSNVGAKVIFIDKNKEAGNENVEYIKRKDGEVEFFLGDIAEEDTLYKFAEFIIKNIKYRLPH